MREKHRIMLVSLCAIMVVVSSVMITLAYLTSKTEKVVNTFTLGNVKFEEGLGNDLNEAKTNENGKPVNKDGAEIDNKDSAPRVTTNKYKLVPGHTYTKDPTIHLAADSEDCYLFVKVENGLTKTKGSINGIEAAAEEGRYTNIVGQMEKNGWYAIDEATYPGIYVYVGDSGDSTPEVVSAKNGDRKKVVFNEFKIDKNITGDKLKEYVVENKDTGTPVDLSAVTNITITAYAVQADGFKDKSGLAIWELVKENFT